MPALAGEDGLFARFSKLAYQSGRQRQLMLDKKWTYHANLSMKDMAVWQHSNGRVVLGFRGTVPTNRQHFVSDANQVIARLPTQRLRDCLQAAQTAIKTLRATKVQVTGHSLGGSTAVVIGRKLHLPGVVFNPGTSPLMKTIPASIKVVREEHDAISTAAGTTPGLLFATICRVPRHRAQQKPSCTTLRSACSDHWVLPGSPASALLPA